MTGGRPRSALAAAGATLALAAAAGCARADTLPEPVFTAVHGRVVGWAKSAPDWFAVYVDRQGGGWCGLDGASWRIALVETAKLPERVVASHRIGSAMCGNSLSWVRAGRFSDGRHREVAFMLWQTPSIGATTYLYRIEADKLELLATFPGDHVALGRGVVTVTYENSGRSPNGMSKNVYRFRGGRYRLAAR